MEILLVCHGKKSRSGKTESKNRFFQAAFKRHYSYLLGLLLILQLFGLPIVRFPYSFQAQLFGFMMVAVGIMISISARISLSTNWTHASEYQIKKKHELVTQGIYRFIRHPIYAGLFLAYVGGTIVA